jgi:hypothetical protein
MLETILGKVLSWIPAPWSGVRVGLEAGAYLCSIGHSPVSFGGPAPRAPRHIDLSLGLWNRSEHGTTVRDIEASAVGQRLETFLFDPITLDPGQKPVDSFSTLEAPSGDELRARAGDMVVVRLALTRGRSPKLKLRIEPESPP